MEEDLQKAIITKKKRRPPPRPKIKPRSLRRNIRRNENRRRMIIENPTKKKDFPPMVPPQEAKRKSMIEKAKAKDIESFQVVEEKPIQEEVIEPQPEIQKPEIQKKVESKEPELSKEEEEKAMRKKMKEKRKTKRKTRRRKKKKINYPQMSLLYSNQSELKKEMDSQIDINSLLEENQKMLYSSIVQLEKTKKNKKKWKDYFGLLSNNNEIILVSLKYLDQKKDFFFVFKIYMNTEKTYIRKNIDEMTLEFNNIHFEKIKKQLDGSTNENDVKKGKNFNRTIILKFQTIVILNNWINEVNQFSTPSSNDILNKTHSVRQSMVLQDGTKKEEISELTGKDCFITLKDLLLDEEDADLSFLEKKYFDYTIEDVGNMLRLIRVSYSSTCFPLYSSFFKQNQINGKLIQEFFLSQKDFLDQILSGLGMSVQSHRDRVKSTVVAFEEGVKDEKDFFYEDPLISKFGEKFDYTQYVVERKVEKMFLKHLNPKTSEKKFSEFVDYCSHFSDLNKIYKTLLYILTKYEDDKKGEKTYKCKFIITENLQDWRVKQVRKVIGMPLNVASKMGMVDIKYGMFHIALGIGPLQIEWVDNSLCLIRSISSENVLLCVDIGNFTTNNVQEFSLKLAREARKWNSDYIYDTINLNLGKLKKKQPNHANCQQFVEYFVKKILKLELVFSKEISDFIDKMKTTGKTKMIFAFDNKFYEKFRNCFVEFKLKKKKELEIENHSKLDLLVHNFIEIEPQFQLLYPGKWDLLKSFDRAFWMKHMNAAKAQKKKNLNFESPHSPDSKVGCPFNKK